MSAAVSPLKNAVDYFENALTLLTRKSGFSHLILAPYFWLTIPPMLISESSSVFLEQYSGLKQSTNLQSLFSLLIKNLKDIFSTASIIGKKKKSLSNGNLIFGKIDSTAELYIQTWLYKDDVDAFLQDRKDRYWGDLRKNLPHNLKTQYLLFALFDISPSQVDALVQNGCVVMNPNYQISLWNLSLRTLSSVKRLVFSNGIFSSIEHRLFFWVSTLNYRYFRANDLLAVFKDKMQLNKKALFLMPWEGQPEQKAICHLFRQQGCRVWGYIHSSATNNPCYLAKFQKTETATYFPEKLLVHGTDFKSTLQPVNWNQEEIELIHSLRFKPRSKSDFQGKLFLPIDVKTSLETLKIARNLVAKGILQITSIASHPANKLNEELNSVIRDFKYSESSSQVIVGGFSAVIFESLEVGCEVINITPNGVGEMDREAYRSIERKMICEDVYRFTLPENKQGALINFKGLGVPAHELISNALL